MLLTVSDFRKQVLGPDLPRLLERLAELTGRNNPREFEAWQNSLTRFAAALHSKALDPLHLYLGDLGSLSLEYRLPASSSWCDLVLLGNDGRRPSAVIVELKHWETYKDVIGDGPGLIEQPSGLTLHPSEQVKGYTEYCRRFHSEFQESSAVVNGCVVFTKHGVNPVYRAAPNTDLVREYPCFSIAADPHVSETLEYLNRRLVNPDIDFAQRFEKGHYRQNRSFIQAIGATLKRSPNRRLELLDEQRKGLFVALAAVRQAVATRTETLKKRVIIVEGPPGSGKSAVAAQLWAELASDPTLPQGDLAFVTTSQAQNHSLEHLFGNDWGAVKKSSHFTPATTQTLGGLKKKFPGHFDDVSKWRENLALLRNVTREFQPADDAYLVSIVDEAHALINPEFPDARGQFGFAVNFGPQAYHIIRGSTVSVFLLDEQQGFRERETTTRADIERWAKELGAEVMPVVSLADRQFRCGGSTEYIEWVEGLLAGKASDELKLEATYWRESVVVGAMFDKPTQLAAELGSNVVPFPNPRRRFAFELVDSPAELDAALGAHHADGNTVRLVASYARPWLTEKAARPHRLPPTMQDFCLQWTNQSGEHTWSRIWNWRNALKVT